MVVARMKAPMKSIRRSFEGLPFGWGGSVEKWEGSFKATRKMARSIRGPWPTKDQRQPMVSARKPPRGPPMLRPRVATTLT
jgi:hypothetical protein